jgi:hypothetical protein
MVSGLESGLKSEMQLRAAKSGAIDVKPREQKSSADQRSAKANDYGRRERRETWLFGDLETFRAYST